MKDANLSRLKRVFIRLGVGVVIFGFGLIFSPVFFPIDGELRSPGEEMLLIGIMFGGLCLGGCLLAVGVIAGVTREKSSRNRCPRCRHRIEQDQSLCPECSANLGVDARGHFTLLSMAVRDSEGACVHCGNTVELTRSFRIQEPVPGRTRCGYCGSLSHESCGNRSEDAHVQANQ